MAFVASGRQEQIHSTFVPHVVSIPENLDASKGYEKSSALLRLVNTEKVTTEFLALTVVRLLIDDVLEVGLS